MTYRMRYSQSSSFDLQFFVSFKNISKTKLLNAGYALSSSCLEYYNYMLLMYLIPVWGKEFFAPGNDVFLKGFGIIFLTALTRPIAANIIGGIGDKFGRRSAMLVCACIMAISCLTISCMPSYSQVPWLAQYGVLTAIVILCRILQIASAAGKLNGSAIFLIEHFPHRAGLISSVIWFATILGMFIASMTDYLCTTSTNKFLWRFCIGIGGLLSIASLFLMKYLRESREYTASKDDSHNHQEDDVTTVSRWAYVAIFCIACGISGMFYYSTSYVPVFYQTKYNLPGVGLYRGWSILIYGLSVLAAGVLCDRCERGGKAQRSRIAMFLIYACVYMVFRLIPGAYGSKVSLIAFLLPFIVPNINFRLTWNGVEAETYAIMLFGATISLLLAVPSLRALLCRGDLSITTFTLCFVGCFVGPSHKVMNKLFPPNKRYKSVSLFYAIGTALIGGSSTFVCLKLQNLHPILPSAFMIFASGMGILGIYASFRSELDTLKIK